ncbi:MAG: IS66 family transposase [Caldilineaceae bacterium]|nr:IS66 family transposase [Caldilineaceae bacterium]MCB9139963.1 IS66 family transposase [Caldilineaceae bacterium]
MKTQPRFSREQLEQLNKPELIDVILLLQEHVVGLEVRVQQLEDQIAKHSGNSSKPPGSDGLGKPKTKSLRKSQGRKPGGQPGHEGQTLEMKSEPDHVQVHELNSCPHCASDLSAVAATDHRRRQVYDIPPVEIEVTEHQAEIKTCPGCRRKVEASFPEDVTQPVQYGPRLKAQAAYLNTYQMIPVARTCELLNDFYGQSPSWDFVRQANQAVASGIVPSLDEIERQMLTSKVVHCDESGLRVAGKLQWLHSVSTERLTLYNLHEKRGQEAMVHIGILPQLTDWIVHDHWKSYLAFDDCNHAFCNAHHLRELQFITDQYEQPWAADMAELLWTIKQEVDESPPECTSLSSERLAHFDAEYDAILQRGFQANPPPNPPAVKQKGRPKQTPPKNLLDRLLKHKTGTLAFMHNFDIPFDNNLAERDIRMVKLKQKISGSFRTTDGADTFCNIRSYISTVRKQGGNVIAALFDSLANEPFIPLPFV